MVSTLQWTLLMVSLLLMERVLGNQTCVLVCHRCYEPQVCLTYHLVFFIFIMHWGQFLSLLFGVG